jgi:hypothetical protein
LSELSEFELDTVSKKRQRYVLAELYNKTGGTSWTLDANWLSSASLSSWEGVQVDSNGDVTYLNLDYNNLVGKMLFLCSFSALRRNRRNNSVVTRYLDETSVY